MSRVWSGSRWLVAGALVLAILSMTSDDLSRRLIPPVSAASTPDPSILRVCADPNNMPFSNMRGEGFENVLASRVAAALHRRLEYFWQPMRRGFIRNTLKAGVCDVVMGVPAAFELARPTRPYYRSTYVFVSRRDRRLNLRSFDDPRLRRWTVGVQLTGDDYENPPPAQALATRGVIANVRGYTVYGDYSKPDPQRVLVDAVASGQLDVAVMWGPQAGFFGSRAAVPLDIVPVSPEVDLPFLPFVYDIAMGVRREDEQLYGLLDAYIEKHEEEIEGLVQEFRFPGTEGTTGTQGTPGKPGTPGTSGTAGTAGTDTITVAVGGDVTGDARQGVEFGIAEVKRTAALLGRDVVLTTTTNTRAVAGAIVNDAHHATEAAGIPTIALGADTIPPTSVCVFVIAIRNQAEVVWHSSLTRFGASELNERYRRSTGRAMTDAAWKGWFAVKAIGEAAMRGGDDNRCAAIAAMEADGHKGEPLSFDPLTHLLKQPLYVLDKDGGVRTLR
jgi:mxaJ protein